MNKDFNAGLSVLRLITGDLIIADVKYQGDFGVFLLKLPMRIVEYDGSITANMFVPGTTVEDFPMADSSILTMGPADEFMAKFYGGALMAYFTQVEERDSMMKTGSPNLDFNGISRLEYIKSELEATYGLFDNNKSNTTVH